jgi:PAS domain S-box-containing protein
VRKGRFFPGTRLREPKYGPRLHHESEREAIVNQVESSTAGRVLVVDDEVEMLKFLAEALPEFGYEIRCSATAGEALEALKEQDFDLLLTDMKLPGMDGIELLRAALEIDPNLVGIVITAYASLETAVEAMRSGAFDYITKPFESAKLLSVLSRAMEVHRLRLENIHLREMMAIYYLAQAAAFPLDDNAFLNQATAAILRQCQGDEVSIMLATPDGQALHMAAAKGKHLEQFVGARVPVEEGVAGWVARNRQSVMLSGTVDDSRFKPINPRPDIRAALSMPMMAAGNFAGVINVNVIHNRRPFSPAAVKALTIMVGMLASILHGSRLFGDLRAAEDKYRSIFENTGNATMIVEEDATISLINRETEERSGYSREELEGKRKWTDFVWEGDLERMGGYHRLRRTDSEAPPKHYEAKLIDKQGKVRDFYLTVGMIPGTGKSVVSMLDITLRKQTEEALQKSEEKYRSIFDNAIEGIFQTTPEGKYLKVNPAFARMYGYDSPEELMEDIEDIRRQQYVNPGDRDRIIELFETQGSVKRFEKQSRKKNGDTFWISITGRTVKDEDGQTLYYEGTVEDITERKQAEDARAKSEALLREAQEAAHIGHWELDTSTMRPAWSEEIFHIFGLDPEEGEPSFEAHRKVTHPDDWGILNNAVTTSIAEGIPFDIEFRILRPDKTIRWMHAIGYPKKDSEGRIVSVFGTNQDITDKKSTEDTLRESESTLRSVVSASPVGIALNTPDSQIVWANQAMADICGYTSDELSGQSARILYETDEEFLRVREVVYSSAQQEGGNRVETRFRRKDGEMRHVQLNVASLVQGEIISGLVCIAEDVTERKQAEEALRVSEEKYRSIFENAIEGIFQTTPDGKYLSVNPAFARMHGYDSPDDFIEAMNDLQTQQYVDPGDRDRLRELCETEGFLGGFETQVYKRDGDMVWIMMNARAARDPNGKVLFCEGTAENITLRKQAVEALERSRTELKAIYENAPVLMCTLDPERHVLYANRAFSEFTGVTEDELRDGRACGVFGCINALDDPRGCGFGPNCPDCQVRLAIEDTLKTGRTHRDVEYRATLEHTGVRRGVVLLGATVLVETAGQTRILLCLHDITERKMAEEALHKREEEFRTVADFTYDWEYWVGPDARLLYVSPSCERITGYGPEEFMNDPSLLLSIIHPEDKPLMKEDLAAPGEHGPHSEDFRIITRSGEIRWIAHACQAVFDGEDRWLGRRASNRDVTKRKGAEEALGKSERKYRSIFENAIEGIFQTTPDGKYLSVNPALARMYGYDSPEELMKSVTDVQAQQYVNPEDRDRLKAVYEEHGLVEGFETEVYKKNGDRVWILMNAQAVKEPNGKVLLYEGTTQDITERKKAEAQRTKTEHRLRRQSERLRALSKKLAQIDETERHRLARELHDRVGGNLTALGINLNILKRQLSETIRPAVHARLDDTLVLLAETVERVRDVMADLRPSVLDDYGLVAALRWYSGQFSLRTGIKVTLAGEELEVRLESFVESALYRIAQEALTNIAKHARASSAEIKWEQRERKVKLAISDDGVGFSPSAVREDGTVQGWGLLIMKERVKALVGGTCTVGLGPEGGTVVMVEVTI